MARKKSFETYMKNIKKAAEYQEELKEIRAKYDMDKKEALIESVKDLMKKEDFIESFVSQMCHYAMVAMDAKNVDKLIQLIESFGGEVDNIVYYFDKFSIGKDRLYISRTYAGCWQEETESIMDLPLDLDLPLFYKTLDEFEDECEILIKKIRQEEAAAEKALEEKRAKEEYDLYLKLKEKYES